VVVVAGAQKSVIKVVFLFLLLFLLKSLVLQLPTPYFLVKMMQRWKKKKKGNWNEGVVVVL